MNDKEREIKFYEMFNENKARIYRLCYGSLSNKEEIDDLFQEVMINAWRNLDKFRGDAKMSTWLYRITVNTAMLYNKRYSRHSDRMSNYEFKDLDESTHSKDIQIDERIEKLHSCITRLKKQDRIIVSLFLEGLSYDEISEITGITNNYVGVKLNRIKAQLAKCIKEDNNE